MSISAMLVILVFLATKTVICSPMQVPDRTWLPSPQDQSVVPNLTHIASGNQLSPIRNTNTQESLSFRRRRFVDSEPQDSLASYLQDSIYSKSAKPTARRTPYDCGPQATIDDQNHEVGRCDKVPCIVYLLPGKIFKQLSLTFVFHDAIYSPKRTYLLVSAKELCITDPSRGYSIEIDLYKKRLIGLDRWTISVYSNCGNRKVEKITDIQYRFHWFSNVLVKAEGSSFWRTAVTHPDCLKRRVNPQTSTTEVPQSTANPTTVTTKAPQPTAKPATATTVAPQPTSKPATAATEVPQPTANPFVDGQDVFTISFWVLFACVIVALLIVVAVVIAKKKH